MFGAFSSRPQAAELSEDAFEIAVSLFQVKGHCSAFDVYQDITSTTHETFNGIMNHAIMMLGLHCA